MSQDALKELARQIKIDPLKGKVDKDQESPIRADKTAKRVEAGAMRRESLRLLQLSAEEAAIELNKKCDYCGQWILPTLQDTPLPLRPNKKTWVFPDRCDCEGAVQAEKQQAEKAAVVEYRQMLDDYQAGLQRAGLVGDLALSTFESFVKRGDWKRSEEIKLKVMTYAEDFLTGELVKYNDNNEPINTPVLLMTGQWGTGKSHLAAAVLRESYDKGKRVYFRNWSDYLQRLQRSWQHQGDKEHEQEEDIIDELRQGDIIVIDDLDKRNPTEWVRSVLYPVINHRVNMGMATIITLNYGPEDSDPQAPGRPILERYFGVAVLDRIIGAAYDHIDFDGPSYRSGQTWRR